MNEIERKERFIALLKQQLEKCGGLKIKLAEELNITPSTLTRWFQGKVDPATIDLAVFVRLTEVTNFSIDDLATFLGLVETSEEQIPENFQNFIQDLLSSQSQETLAKKLGISLGAVAGWVRSQRKVDPRRVAIGTLAGLAKEKAWTLERLLIFLGLKQVKTENDLLFKLQTGATILSFNEQVKLLGWLSDLIEEKVVKGQISQIPTAPFVNSLDKNYSTKLIPYHTCIILEKEDLAIGSTYLKNLNIYTKLQLENIDIATINKIPENLKNFDLLIFDIQTEDSTAIELIKKISFDGDIVIFTSPDLEKEVRSQLKDKVTDIVVKPRDWESLKDKPYFARI